MQVLSTTGFVNERAMSILLYVLQIDDYDVSMYKVLKSGLDGRAGTSTVLNQQAAGAVHEAIIGRGQDKQ